MITEARKLPAGAYESLRGFKGQAAAAMQMLEDRTTGKEELREAQKLMSANPEWTTLIYRGLTSGLGGITGIDEADEDWLDRVFEGHPSAV